MLFGGRSAEHDVSCASALNILRSMDRERYEPVLVGIARSGEWRALEVPEDLGAPAAKLSVPEDGPVLALLPGGRGKALVVDQGAAREILPVDMAFPVLHGPHGEDGTVQGMFEVANIPYVGSGVAGSAISMDKDVTKRLLHEAGLPTPRFLALTVADTPDYRTATEKLGSAQMFVKPANMGSSVGVSRVGSEAEYRQACATAFRFDRKILVEECIANAREIECSVLESDDGELRISPLGEIVPHGAQGFYSYESKYIDSDGASLVIPAELPEQLESEIADLALSAFKVLGCEGLARIDFFVSVDRVLVNEANTLPGFTDVSMYPKLWTESGMSQKEVLDTLLSHALQRHRAKEALSSHR